MATHSISLDDAVAFYRAYLEAERAACVGWLLHDPAPVQAAKALLERVEPGQPFNRYVCPQPWGGGWRLDKPSPDDTAKARRELEERPFAARPLFAVELRSTKTEGVLAIAYVGPNRPSIGNHYEMRLAARALEGKLLLCQTAHPGGTLALGLQLKTVGKLLEGRRFEEPAVHDQLRAAWEKLPP